jgi:hypothetical protein
MGHPGIFLLDEWATCSVLVGQGKKQIPFGHDKKGDDKKGDDKQRQWQTSMLEACLRRRN